VPQAKGILPRRDDKEVLYKNPQTCGYFASVKLDSAIDRPRAEAWLGEVGRLVDELVERLPAKRGQEKGDKVAAVAVGLAPSFFILNGQPRFDPPLEPPAAFAIEAAESMPNRSGVLASTALLDSDVFFYIASVFEARVNAFLSALAAMRPDVASLTFDRGYQRLDGTEPFGYADGLRNIRKQDRSDFVFVDRDERNLEEPAWAHDGSYMVFLKIQQHPDAFAGLPDDPARDAVIGRIKMGDRLDLVGQNIDPKDEPAEPPPNLPPSSHVAKVGPRGKHDDTQIFRRGLPFIESSPDGQPRIGLHFCSFQASLDQFDVVFNDWALNPHFPVQDGTADALLDPARQPAPTTFEKVGFFFVPPFREEGLSSTVFGKQPKPRKPKEGRLVVHKRVVDPTDSSRRFERGGFVFQILDGQGQVVGAQFTSDSAGRAVCPTKLQLGQTYSLQELVSPVPNVDLQTRQFQMEKSHQLLRVVNSVTQPNGPYGQR
jgi:Dyp-type peroxidase family